jgi:hypothetical protein
MKAICGQCRHSNIGAMERVVQYWSVEWCDLFKTPSFDDVTDVDSQQISYWCYNCGEEILIEDILPEHWWSKMAYKRDKSCQ